MTQLSKAIITPTCQENRGRERAWEEAVRRLHAFYDDISSRWPVENQPTFTLILDMERPPRDAILAASEPSKDSDRKIELLRGDPGGVIEVNIDSLPSSATELIWEKDSENNQINTDGWTITFWEGCGDDTCHKSTWQLSYDEDFTVERDDPEELKRIAAKIVAALDDKGER